MWPKPDVVVVAPATFNTINQWALGITDKWLVGVVAEGIGKGHPHGDDAVREPGVRCAPAVRSIDTLRSAGVRVRYGEGDFIPNEPGQGNPSATYPGRATLDAVADVLGLAFIPQASSRPVPEWSARVAKTGSKTGRNPVDRSSTGGKRYLTSDATGIPFIVTLTSGNCNESRSPSRSPMRSRQ